MLVCIQDLSYSKLRHLTAVLRQFHTQTRRFSSKAQEQRWQAVIGLELHAQMATKSKLFSGSPVQFAAPINSQVSFFDAAQPGTLPVLNKGCVKAGIKTALALSCQVNKVSYFDRKHYFYADLPTGYQITQQRRPLAVDGEVKYVVYNPAVMKRPERKMANIIQVQLEQDSGKSLHDPDLNHSLIDLNRAGVGLMEIVTAPDFSGAEDAAAFVKELQLILQTIGTCDGKMQEGSLRVDANISLHKEGEPFGVRAEVKNINSIRNVAKAIDFEIKRQTKLLDTGGEVINETRSFDHESGETVPMRDKERLQDYRFMPEPNLPPLRIYNSETKPGNVESNQVVNMDDIGASLPMLPEAKRDLLQRDYGLTLEHSIIIVNVDGLYDFFLAVMSTPKRNAKTVVNLILNEVLTILNKEDMEITQCPLSPEAVGETADMLDDRTISKSVAKKVLDVVFKEPSQSAVDVVTQNDWVQITDRPTIEAAGRQVLLENTKAVAKFKKGKKKAAQHLVNKVISKLDGRADPKLAVDVIHALLQEES